MKRIATALAAITIVAAVPASALDRYRCALPDNTRPLTLEIDQTGKTMAMADEPRKPYPVCTFITGGLSDQAAAIQRCNIKVTPEMSAAEVPARNGNEVTIMAFFDRRDMSFQVVGRGTIDNFRFSLICKPIVV